MLMRVVFGIPFRGSIFLVLGAAALCLLCGISIGTFIATFTKSARQAQLTLFFVNPPLTSLSGAFTPVEAMPKWLQPSRNSIHSTFGVIARGAMLKEAESIRYGPISRTFGVHRAARCAEYMAVQKSTQLTGFRSLMRRKSEARLLSTYCDGACWPVFAARGSAGVRCASVRATRSAAGQTQGTQRANFRSRDARAIERQREDLGPARAEYTATVNTLNPNIQCKAPMRKHAGRDAFNGKLGLRDAIERGLGITS